jgi:hypothetical protein
MTGTVSLVCTRCGCKRLTDAAGTGGYDDRGCIVHEKCKTPVAESRYFTQRKRQKKQKQAALHAVKQHEELTNA